MRRLPSDELVRITGEMAEFGKLKDAKVLQEVGASDVLLVPDIFYEISHRFSELEGKGFANQALKGQILDVVQQDIEFRLDRSGAEIKSEAKMFYESVATHFVFDRPFLVYMKKRDSDMPYFVMWVENAELLRKWE